MVTFKEKGFIREVIGGSANLKSETFDNIKLTDVI